MEKHIAVLGGDGIGPEVTSQAIHCLTKIGELYGHSFSFEEGKVGAVAIDHCGDPFPQETYELCLRSDAILFGAIGDPKYDNDPKAVVRPEQGLLKMRKVLKLFTNIRPVRSYPLLFDSSPLKNHILENIDFVVFRELTGGLYFNYPRGRSEDGKQAFETSIYHEEEINRIAHLAFQAARNRRSHLTLVDKANVLPTSRLWRELVGNMAAQHYPDVTYQTLFVDNAAMQLIVNPSQFDVILTENLFGDILSDEGSVLAGSLGMLPSASIGEGVGVFEPVHGSYPQAAGKNIANPFAAILSAAMLLELGLGLVQEARSIEKAVFETLESGVVTSDIRKKGASNTEAVGNAVAQNIK